MRGLGPAEPEVVADEAHVDVVHGGAGGHADPVRGQPGSGQPRVGVRLARGVEEQARAATAVAERHRLEARVIQGKVPDLGRDTAGVLGGVEVADGTDAVLPREETTPDDRHAGAQRGDDSHARDHDPMLRHKTLSPRCRAHPGPARLPPARSAPPTTRTVSRRTPPSTLAIRARSHVQGRAGPAFFEHGLQDASQTGRSLRGCQKAVQLRHLTLLDRR